VQKFDIAESPSKHSSSPLSWRVWRTLSGDFDFGTIVEKASQDPHLDADDPEAGIPGILHVSTRPRGYRGVRIPLFNLGNRGNATVYFETVFQETENVAVLTRLTGCTWQPTKKSRILDAYYLHARLVPLEIKEATQQGTGLLKSYINDTEEECYEAWRRQL
jgi:hypothetical protein